MLKTIQTSHAHESAFSSDSVGVIMFDRSGKQGINYAYLFFPTAYRDKYKAEGRAAGPDLCDGFQLETNDFGTAMDAIAEYLEQCDRKLAGEDKERPPAEEVSQGNTDNTREMY